MFVCDLLREIPFPCPSGLSAGEQAPAVTGDIPHRVKPNMVKLEPRLVLHSVSWKYIGLFYSMVRDVNQKYIGTNIIIYTGYSVNDHSCRTPSYPNNNNKSENMRKGILYFSTIKSMNLPSCLNGTPHSKYYNVYRAYRYRQPQKII